jgi:hypothetical protein
MKLLTLVIFMTALLACYARVEPETPEWVVVRCVDGQVDTLKQTNLSIYPSGQTIIEIKRGLSAIAIYTKPCTARFIPAETTTDRW